MTYTSLDVQAWTKYLFVEEVHELKRLAQLLPDNPTVVNIGAGNGTSGLAFLESRPDLELFTVDIQDESSPFGCLEGERAVFTRAGFPPVWHKKTNPYPYHSYGGNRWRQWHADSKTFGRDFDGLVDMVFVDGDHSYEGAAGDIKEWLGHIAEGGIIAVHDYKKGEYFEKNKWDEENHPHFKDYPGVDQAVDELLVARYPLCSRVATLVSFYR